MTERPYIQIESQDYFAEKDPFRDNGVIVREIQPVLLQTLSEYVEIGRDRCLATEIPPPSPEDILLPLVLENVMGQEDIFRLGGDGQRELNTQTARIVATSVRPTTLLIEYGAVVQDPLTGLESWTLSESHEETTATGYHDFVISPVSPDTLYAFKVTVTDAETGTVLESDVHFFRTEDFIVLDLDILVNVSMVKVTVGKSIEETVNQMAAAHAFPDPPNVQTLPIPSATLDIHTVAHEEDLLLTSTELALSVSWQTV